MRAVKDDWLFGSQYRTAAVAIADGAVAGDAIDGVELLGAGHDALLALRRPLPRGGDKVVARLLRACRCSHSNAHVRCHIRASNIMPLDVCT